MSDTTVLPPLTPQTPSTPQVPQMTPASTPLMPTPPAEVFGDDIKSDIPSIKPSSVTPLVSTQPPVSTPPLTKPADTHTSLDQALADLEKEAMKLAGDEGKQTKEVQPKIAESKSVEKPVEKIGEKLAEPAPMKQELPSLSNDLEKPFVVTPKTDTLPPLPPTSPVIKPMIQLAEKPAVKPVAPVTPGAGMETLKAHTSSTTSVFDTKMESVEEKPTVTPPVTSQPVEKGKKKEKDTTVESSADSGSGKKKKGFVKKIVAAAALAVLVIGLGVGIFVAQQSQDVRQQAASGCIIVNGGTKDAGIWCANGDWIKHCGDAVNVPSDEAMKACEDKVNELNGVTEPVPPTNDQSSTTTRCTAKDGSLGETCGDLSKCDIAGGCNPACGSGTRDGKICDIPNGYCTSGYSCRPGSNSVNVKKCDGNQCVNSWCDTADVGTDRCKTCSSNSECTVDNSSLPTCATGLDCNLPGDRFPTGAISCASPVSGKTMSCCPAGYKRNSLDPTTNYCVPSTSGNSCPNDSSKQIAKCYKFVCPNGCELNKDDPNGVEAWRCSTSTPGVQIQELSGAACLSASLNGQCGQIDMIDTQGNYCGYTASGYNCGGSCQGNTPPLSNPPDESPPPTNPPGAPMCQGIAKDITAPKAGDQVAFTCTQSTDATRYEFRYRVGSGAFTALDPLNATARTSKSLTVQDGTYDVQCRPCTNNTCASWSTAN